MRLIRPMRMVRPLRLMKPTRLMRTWRPMKLMTPMWMPKPVSLARPEWPIRLIPTRLLCLLSCQCCTHSLSQNVPQSLQKQRDDLEYLTINSESPIGGPAGEFPAFFFRPQKFQKKSRALKTKKKQRVTDWRGDRRSPSFLLVVKVSLKYL